MIQAAKEIWDNRQTLGCQFNVNIKTTVITTKLGALWWVLDPLFFMCIYYFVIVIIFRRGGENYHLFALSGIVTWQAFTRSVTLCANSLVRSAGLIKQISLPMFLYVVISPIVQAFFYSIGLILIILWNIGVVGYHTFAVIVLILLMIVMTSAVGLFLSIIQVYVRDTARFIAYALRMGFWLSPVLYSADRFLGNKALPVWAKTLYASNPMVHFLSAVRDVVLYGRMFDWSKIIIMFVIAGVVLQLGLLFFRKISPSVPKRL
jgi:ABC-type polysaccharide/polyol phosphate export permease